MKYIFIFLITFLALTDIQAQAAIMGPGKSKQAELIISKDSTIVDCIAQLPRKPHIEPEGWRRCKQGEKQEDQKTEVPSKEIFGILIPTPIIWMFAIILWIIIFVVALSAWMHKMKIPPMGKLKCLSSKKKWV